MKRIIFLSVFLLGGISTGNAANSALGQDEASEHVVANIGERDTKIFQLTPYIWASGLKGDISPFRRAPTIHVHKPFSDIIDNLKLGGFVNLWGRYDDFVLSGDVMYVDTSDHHGAGPLAAMQLPGLGVTIPVGAQVNAKVETKQFMATVAGGYRVIDKPSFTLDMLGGVRYWHISNDVMVTASHPFFGNRSGNYRESFNWLDPVLGMRAFVSLTDRASFQAQADIGGFGVGADFTWSTLATLNYSLNNHLSLSTGYKILSVDYDHASYVYDTVLSGPVLGVTWRF